MSSVLSSADEKVIKVDTTTSSSSPSFSNNSEKTAATNNKQSATAPVAAATGVASRSDHKDDDICDDWEQLDQQVCYLE